MISLNLMMIGDYMVYCPHCNGYNSDKNKFCENCGFKLPDPENYCPECDITYSSKNFCPECGTKLIAKSKLNEYFKEKEEFQREEQLYNRISLQLDENHLNLFKKDYYLDNNLSYDETIYYIIRNYSEDKIDLLIEYLKKKYIDEINRIAKIEEINRKQECYKQLYDYFKNHKLELFILKKDFSLTNSFDADFINYLIYNFQENEIENLKNDAHKQERFYKNLSQNELNLLSEKYSVEKDQVIYYLIENFTFDEVKEIRDELNRKDMLSKEINKFSHDDLVLFSKEYSLSGDELFEYLINNFNYAQLMSKRKKLREKQDLFNEIKGFDSEILFWFSKGYLLSGDELVEYLVDNFSREEILNQRKVMKHKKNCYHKLKNFDNHSLALFSKKYSLFGDELLVFLTYNFTYKDILEEKEELLEKEYDEYVLNLYEYDKDKLYLLCYELSLDVNKKYHILKALMDNFTIDELKNKVNKLFEQDWFGIIKSKLDLKQMYLLGKYFSLSKYGKEDLLKYLRENCSNAKLSAAIIFMQQELNNDESVVNSISFYSINFETHNLCLNCGNKVNKIYVKCNQCKSEQLMIGNSDKE